MFSMQNASESRYKLLSDTTLSEINDPIVTYNGSVEIDEDEYDYIMHEQAVMIA